MLGWPGMESSVQLSTTQNLCVFVCLLASWEKYPSLFQLHTMTFHTTHSICFTCCIVIACEAAAFFGQAGFRERKWSLLTNSLVRVKSET